MQELRSVSVIEITKEFAFEAAHRLNNPDCTEQENKDLFHACNNMHGHSYKLYVTVEGMVESKTGFVVDFKKLKTIVKEKVVDVYDHSYINDLPVFKQNPTITVTCENMLTFMWNILNPLFKEMDCNLKELKLYETATSYAIYRGVTLLIDRSGKVYTGQL